MCERASGEHRRGIFDAATRDELLAIVASFPVAYEAPDAARIASRTVPLAARRGLSVYDASYLDLALHSGRRLASCDGRLCEAAALEGISLL